MNSLSEALAGLEFFLDTLIDNHVGIHGHTQGQDETCDTRQGEHCSEGCEDTEEEDDVGDKGYVSCKTCSLVEEYHIEEHEAECNQE